MVGPSVVAVGSRVREVEGNPLDGFVILRCQAERGWITFVDPDRLPQRRKKDTRVGIMLQTYLRWPVQQLVAPVPAMFLIRIRSASSVTGW